MMRKYFLFLWAFCQPWSLMAADRQGDRLYFPPAEGEWQRVAPASIGWDTEKLKEALEVAGRNKSSGVVILYRGRILAEQYWRVDAPEETAEGKPNPYFHLHLGKDTRGQAIEDAASVQKSITAMLVGIARHKGLLKLDDPVRKYLGEGWSGAAAAAEKKITIRHLMTMTSGLTRKLKYQAPAGARWVYNTPAYSRALTCVARAAGIEPVELTRRWLTEPAGMNDSRWVIRPWAERVGGGANKYGFATTARDLARFGLLMLANGKWDGKDVLLDTEYIKAATSPSQELNPSYGYLWWLNGGPFVVSGGKGARREGRWISTAPQDMYGASGRLGRRLYVIPSNHLVIARLGDKPGSRFPSEFFRLLKTAGGR